MNAPLPFAKIGVSAVSVLALLVASPASATDPGGANIGVSGSGSGQTLSVQDAPGGQFVPFANVDGIGHKITALPSFVPTAPIVAANLAGVRATAPGAQTVVRIGYASANDAPPLTYTWQATCPGTPDNVALYIAPTTGAGGGCWSAAADPNVGEIREWGATTTDAAGTVNSAAIQAAANALPAGYTIWNRSAGCFPLASTVVVSKQGQGIDGLSAGDNHDVITQLNTISCFRAVTYGMTMFRYKSATTQALSGNFFRNNFLDGNDAGHTAYGQGGVGVELASVRQGKFDVVGTHFQTSLVVADIDTSLGEPAGVNNNEFWIHGYQTDQFDGAMFVCNSTVLWDCSQDVFYKVEGDYSGASAQIILNGTDSEQFINSSFYSNDVGGTTGALRLSAGATDGQAARNNIFYYFGDMHVTLPRSPVYAEGAQTGRPSPSNRNTIIFLDTANNPGVPTIDTGATLTWGSLQNQLPGGALTAGIQLANTTFAGLPACGAGTFGNQYAISDAATATFGATISAGGGTSHVIAFCNATNWTVH